MSQQRTLARLKTFSACDVSDALLKLGSRTGGFLPDIHPRTRSKAHISYPIVGRAWTVRFVEKAVADRPNFAGHYIDHVPAAVELGGHKLEGWPVIPVLGAPDSFNCAVLGGIMALQASLRRAFAIVVSGRVRDLEELNSANSTAAVYSRGISTVGAGAESKVITIGVDCHVTGYGNVSTGDIVFIDTNGIVVIPSTIDLETLLQLMTTLSAQDDNVKKSIEAGMSVEDAFKKWRA